MALCLIGRSAAGISLEQFLDEKVFKPLGMTRTVLDLDCTGQEKWQTAIWTSLFEEEHHDGNLIWDDITGLSFLRSTGCACVKIHSGR